MQIFYEKHSGNTVSANAGVQSKAFANAAADAAKPSQQWAIKLQKLVKDKVVKIITNQWNNGFNKVILWFIQHITKKNQ